MKNLVLSLIQSDLFWEDKARNLAMFEEKIAQVPQEAQVVVLPEMFSTGFSMNPAALAESMDGGSVDWMRSRAAKYKKIIVGSLIISVEGQYFNRMIWMQPNGLCHWYDKRHLFGFAGEDQLYQPGERRVVVQVNGWKICLLICYDLRFPVWSRQTGSKDEAFDLLLYVANWPEKRIAAWDVLLQARAIENQCYVVGVNRVGEDGFGIAHNGHSALIDPWGEVVWQGKKGEEQFTCQLEKQTLLAAREKFPFLKDADQFVIT